MNFVLKSSYEAFKSRPTGLRTEEREGQETNVAHLCVGIAEDGIALIIEGRGATPLKAVLNLTERVKSWVKMLSVGLNEEFQPMLQADEDRRVAELLKALDPITKPLIPTGN